MCLKNSWPRKSVRLILICVDKQHSHPSITGTCIHSSWLLCVFLFDGDLFALSLQLHPRQRKKKEQKIQPVRFALHCPSIWFGGLIFILHSSVNQSDNFATFNWSAVAGEDEWPHLFENNLQLAAITCQWPRPFMSEKIHHSSGHSIYCSLVFNVICYAKAGPELLFWTHCSRRVWVTDWLNRCPLTDSSDLLKHPASSLAFHLLTLTSFSVSPVLATKKEIQHKERRKRQKVTFLFALFLSGAGSLWFN